MTVELLPRKEFILKAADGKQIRGKFSLWALKRVCDVKKYTLSELGERMAQENITMDDLIQLILRAVEDAARREKVGFSYTDQDVCDWIEEMGGLDSPEFQALLGHSRSELEEVAAEDEKKSQ